MAAPAGMQNGDGPVAHINVVPLVDIMLVMLVIFMVTAPMLQQGVDVDLPKATNAPLKGNNEQVVLSINAKGEVFLGAGNRLPLDGLADKVHAVMKQRPPDQRKIYVKADQQLPYGTIMEVMGKLHAGGITEIGLVSAPVEPDSKRQKS